MLFPQADNIKRVSGQLNSVVGGDLVSILLRQSVRLGNLLRTAQFQSKKLLLQQMNPQLQKSFNPNTARLQAISPTYSPPYVFLAGIPVTTKSQETYQYSSDATQFPVESGSMLTDHVILQPLRITVAAEICNWEDGRPEYALQLLEEMWRLRLPIELQTVHKKIPDMVLVNLQVENTVPAWGALSFRATFQSISLITLQTEKYSTGKVTPTSKTSGANNSKSVESPVRNGKSRPNPLGAGPGVSVQSLFRASH